MIKLTEIAHQLILDQVKSANLIVDTTLGNGHDLIFLLNNSRQDAKVFGFDIQEKAILSTQEKLAERGLNEKATLILDCHSNLLKYLPTSQQLDLAVFNLGYLPGGDKNITTEKTNSLECLKICLQRLANNGMISLMLYPGHDSGAIETTAILEYLESISSKYQIFTTKAEYSKRTPPIHCLIKLLA